LHVIASNTVGRTNLVLAHAAPFHATALVVFGKCDYSEDGVTFTNFERGHNFEPGAILRTGQEGWTDLFFRRSGTAVRLEAGTEIKLETIAVTITNRRPSEHILLDLRAGRILTVVRPCAAGSTLEIKNAAGRSVVEGSGGGKYIITADGTHVSADGSVLPLKLIGENGTTFIAAGQQLTSQDGKVLPLSSASCAKDLAQLEELKTSTDAPAARRPLSMP
jgi:hypothetical protein